MPDFTPQPTRLNPVSAVPFAATGASCGTASRPLLPTAVAPVANLTATGQRCDAQAAGSTEPAAANCASQTASQTPSNETNGAARATKTKPPPAPCWLSARQHAEAAALCRAGWVFCGDESQWCSGQAVGRRYLGWQFYEYAGAVMLDAVCNGALYSYSLEATGEDSATVLRAARQALQQGRQQWQSTLPVQLTLDDILTATPRLTPGHYQALSLHQPFASLIALGIKHWETRSWATRYRGSLVICATKRQPDSAELCAERRALCPALPGIDALPFGCTVALVELQDCLPITPELIAAQSDLELECGDWRPGRWAWKLAQVRPLQAQRVRGRQRLWTLRVV